MPKSVFRITLFITLGYLFFLVFLPLFGLAESASRISLPRLMEGITSPSALSAFRLTFLYSFIAALTNTVLGTLVAWVLVRYSFPGRELVNSLVDLPLALPGAIGGLALVGVFAPNGVVGRFFLEHFSVELAYNSFGIYIALVFSGIPFVVRSVQPILESQSHGVEEAATMLGARPYQCFFRVLLPTILPAAYSGGLLAFARGIGEYGAVVYLAGNVPVRSEVISRHIYNRVDQYDIVGATAVTGVLLGISFLLLFLLNYTQRRLHE